MGCRTGVRAGLRPPGAGVAGACRFPPGVLARATAANGTCACGPLGRHRRRPPIAHKEFLRPPPHGTAPAPVYRVRLTLTAKKGTVYVDRGEQGCCGPV